MANKVKKWDLKTDVLVVGSGGAGLTAALLARDQGVRVALLERSDKIGGTTAVSGGGVWIPLNPYVEKLSIQDSLEEAMAYCKRITAGRAEDDLVETFVIQCIEMVRYLEKTTSLRLSPISMPDYHPEEKGGRGAGRTLEPQLFNKNELGEWADKLRPAPMMIIPALLEELSVTYQSLCKPQNLPMDLIQERMAKGLVALGNALIGCLLKACLDRGVKILMEARARELIQAKGQVTGLVAEKGGKTFLARSRGGVILASGGYEWNQKIISKYLPGKITHPNSPPFNEGDGLLMTAEIGADLANMSEAWWFPSGLVPGEEYEGKPLSRLLLMERSIPHSLMVNRYGQRFVNESANYNDMAKSLYTFDANASDYRNQPCWLIFDRQYRENYSLLTLLPGTPDPDWLTQDQTLKGLAQKVGIDPNGLETTVTRFNGFARDGQDLEFNRGGSAYDRFMGDHSAPHPNLGTVGKPPFYALPIYLGALGTKGGPRTNAHGEVLHVRGNVIPGLYAAGNVMAGVSGPGYYGGGTPISIGMTWGYISGIKAAKAAKKGKGS